SREEGDVAVTRRTLDLHRTLADDAPDLAIWGESALDPGSLSIIDEVRATIAEVGASVVSGATSRDIRSTGAAGPQLYNQAVGFDATGTVVDVSPKTAPVPCGV